MQPTAEAARPSLTPEISAACWTLARQTLIDYLGTPAFPNATILRLPGWRRVPSSSRCGAANSGELRGCRGEIVAHFPLWEAVVQMTVASATDDPRFEPVTLAEVPLLHIEISMLTPLVPLQPEAVEIGRHGLMIVLGSAARAAAAPGGNRTWTGSPGLLAGGLLEGRFAGRCVAASRCRVVGLRDSCVGRGLICRV